MFSVKYQKPLNMNLLTSLCCLIAILQCSYAPPVTENKSSNQDSPQKDELDLNMEYHRYLKEVVQALESDPDFRERLEKADEEDVRSGKIAEQLDFVNHNVRTKLDEIKRKELERLRHLATKQFELTNELEPQGKVPTNEHLDHANPHTFEVEDLKKLIKKTTADLEEADKQRREEFKEYEMQKEFEKHQKLETLDETHKKEFEENLKKEEEAKKHHQPLHHPGSKQQLEEVWEKQDHMDQKFNPKAFFMMHDVDGNGVWDADEVKALFIKELDKLYGPGGPNKDLHERAEEMERMREHVFNENDKNRDGLIDFNEFLMETQRNNQDEGWKSIDENQVYSQQEYQEYERRRLNEIRYLQHRGLVDAHGTPLPGAQHQIHKALQELYHQQQTGQQPYYPNQGQAPQGQYPVPNQGQYPPQNQGQHPPQYQGQQPPQYQGQQPPQYQGQQPPQNPGQYPPQYQGQYPPQNQGQYPPQNQGQYPPQNQGQYQAPNQGQHQIPQGQVPQGQIPQGQVPQGQIPQGQVPQGQVSQGQVPQGQVPQVAQAQNPPGQVPQAQSPQGQVPPVQIAQGQIPQAQVQQGHPSPNTNNQALPPQPAQSQGQNVPQS